MTIAVFRNEAVSTRSFRGQRGRAEHFLAITAPPALDFAGQVDYIEDRYAQAQRHLGIDPESAIFRRIFVSDILNQADPVRRSALFRESAGNPVAVSLVQQPPLPGSKIALLAYHAGGAASTKKQRVSRNHLLVGNGMQDHLWSCRLACNDGDRSNASGRQTRAVFDELVRELRKHGANLRDHCIRTWLYIKGIDLFYQGMVDDRRALFVDQGLTNDTHFIASTGIEGSGAHRHDLVLMDACSLLDAKPGQVSFLNDFERLCATKDYNVTFERATRVAFADRAHIYISGTASIDREGRVLHPGDVLRQLDRAVENVESLLHAGNATLEDMMYFIVYLRDHADAERVRERFAARLPDIPAIYVIGPVCRPEWLIEIEGVAIPGGGQPGMPPF